MLLRNLFESTASEVAIIFGRFNPPHKGHRTAWEMASESPVWFVGTNKSTVGSKDPLPFNVKVEAMKTVWPEIEGHIVAEQSWLTLASEVYKKHPKATLLCLTDEDWVTKTIVQYNGKEGAHGFYNFPKITQKKTPRLSSATALRDAVIKDDRDAFSQAAGIDADTKVAGKSFFDLVAEYLLPYQNAPKKVAKKKKETEPNEHIVKHGSGYRLVSKQGGKNLGTYPTKAGAEKRERQVQYFKHSKEEITEGTSIGSTLRAIINDIGEPITSVYETMKFQAKKYVENHGELDRGFKMVAAGIGGRWVQNMYVGKLQNELYDLCKYNPRRTVELQEFLKGVEIKGELEMKRSFGSISKELPEILVKIGKYIDAPQLVKNANRWIENKISYEKYISSLETEDEYNEPKAAKTPKSNTIGQQNVQVDQIINHVLSKLPKNVQGDVRNTITRSSNKLQALQVELQKRGIKMEGVAEGVAKPLPTVLYHGGSKPISKFNVPAQGAYFSPHRQWAEEYGDVITAAKVNAKNVYLIDYTNDIDEEIVDALFDRDYQTVAKFIKLLQSKGYDAMQTVTDSEMVVVFPGTHVQVIDDEQGVAEGDATKKLSGATPAPAPNPYLKNILMQHIEEVRRFVQTGYIDPTEPMFQELYEYFANEIPEPVRRSPIRLARRIGDMIAPYAKFYANQKLMNGQGVAEGESKTIAQTARRLADPKDGAKAKLRAAGDKRREDQLKYRDIAKRNESFNLKTSLQELSSDMLGRYKKAASADASKSDKEGNFKRGDKRFSGIVKATKKQFDNDTKKSK